MQYKIYTVFLGDVITDKGDSLRGTPHGVPLKTVYSCFALRDENGKAMLVDSGLPSQEDIVKNHKPYRRMPGAPDFVTALANTGVDPDEIETVVLTHLHYDHSCNLKNKKNLKEVYVQQKELLYAIAPKKEDLYYYSLREDCGGPEWTDALGKFKILDGDSQICEGVHVLLTPGHSPGSQSVDVDTAEGVFILTGDFISILESFTTRTPNAILNNEKDWFDSYEKIAAIPDAIILPSHEKRIFDRRVYG